MKKETIVIVSGGWDPIHSGHIELIKRASEFGWVHVIINSDEWLTRKKGKPFMEYKERETIIRALKDVSRVWAASDDDDSVSETIRYIHQAYKKNYVFLFANGGDRAKLNTPEVDTCVELGIGLVWGLGDKIQSSSELIKKAQK